MWRSLTEHCLGVALLGTRGGLSARQPAQSRVCSATLARVRHLIIGDGGAGITAAETIRGEDSAAAIGILTDDPNPAYFRAALTNFLLGELREDQIWAVPPDYYEAAHIHRVYTRVTAVDSGNQRISLSSGSAEPYDQLLIASGARARAPDFPGAHLPGVMTMRTVQDVRAVLDAINSGRVQHAVVLGGGALGLEWAHGMLEHGAKVTLLEFASRLLPRSLDPVASDLLAARLRGGGVEVHLGDVVAEAHPGPDGHVARVITKQGRQLEVQLVAAAIGVQCNTEFLQGSGVQLSERGAVVVDRNMRTNVQNVFSAGDCAVFEGQCLQLWEPARAQGRIAGLNMCGEDARYEVGEHYFATRLFDLDFAAVGSVQGHEGADELVDFPRGTGSVKYRRLIIKQGRLVGALMVGQRSSRVRAMGRAYKKLIDAKVDVSQVQQQLLDPGFDVRAFLRKRVVERDGQLSRSVQPPGQSAQPLSKVPGYRATMAVGMRAMPAEGAAPATERKTLASLQEAAQRAAQQAQQQAAPQSAQQLSIGLPSAAAAPAPASQAQPGALGANLMAGNSNWPVPARAINVGSDPSCEVRLAGDPYVSPMHAQVQEYHDKIFVRDLGSHSGTRVNGQPLTQTLALRHHDKIQIGHTELVLHCPQLAAAMSQRSGSHTNREPVPRLEFRSGHALGLSFALGQQPAVIGSDGRSHFHLEDMTVAPQHVSVRALQGRAFITDLGSHQGTWLAGHRLPPRQEVELQEGAELRLGDVIAAYTATPTYQGSALRTFGQVSVVAGAAQGAAVRINSRLYVGGRRECGLVVPDAGAAMLEIVEHDDQFWVRDPHGVGGGSLRGQPIGQQALQLQHEDVLLLGPAMLRFEEVS